jgi:uncharacterized protein (UPF0335 family)
MLEELQQKYEKLKDENKKLKNDVKKISLKVSISQGADKKAKTLAVRDVNLPKHRPNRSLVSCSNGAMISANAENKKPRQN